MTSSFTDYLNSDYLGAYASLLPKSAPIIINVYVESEEDIAFWRNILHSYETPKIRFEIKLPSNTSLAKGKSKALARSNDIFDLVTGEVGKFLLICVDSDYDYLLCEHYETEAKRTIAKKIQENDYIFQTYAYSIENLKCYAESLHTVCVAATVIDTQKLDFIAFMQAYSMVIYDLFLWNLLFYSKGEDNDFTLTSFCSSIKILESPNIAELGKTLQNVREKVNQKVSELEAHFPTYKLEISALGKKLKNLGLEKENTYLFAQGHTIFDNVVLMLLKSVCKVLKYEKEESIKSLAKHEQEKIDNLNKYKKQVGKLDDEIVKILSNNTEFKPNFLFSKIKQDIEFYMKQFS